MARATSGRLTFVHCGATKATVTTSVNKSTTEVIGDGGRLRSVEKLEHVWAARCGIAQFGIW
jgi:hypothetical protein